LPALPQVRTFVGLRLSVLGAVRLFITIVPKFSEPVLLKASGLVIWTVTVALDWAADAGEHASAANGSASSAPTLGRPPNMCSTIAENG
jgi:hypothetical protein